MADERLRIVLNLDGSGQVTAALKGVKSGLSETQASIITLNQGLDLLGKGWALASQGIQIGARFLGDAIKASNEQENALKALNQTLVSTGQYTAAYSQQLQDLASEFQNTTTFADEVVLSVERQLVAFGATPDVVKKATAAVLDLAASGKDLDSSTQAVGKAIAGNFRALQQMGIQVDDNATKAQKLDQAFVTLNQRVGGQAKAAAETFSGSLEQLNNQWGEFLEKVGDAIKRSDFATDALAALKAELVGLNNSTARAADPMAEFANTVLKGLALGAADAALVVGHLIDFIVRLGETVTIVPNALLGRIFGDFDFDTQVTDWRALSHSIEGNLAVVSDLKARMESFGTDAPRQLAAVGAAAAGMGESGGAGFEKLGAKEKEAKKALDDYREAVKLTSSGNELLGNSFDPVKTKLDAVQKLLIAVGKGVVPESAVNVAKLKEEFFNLSEELEARALPRLEDVIAELRGPGKEAFAGLTDEVKELERTAAQVNMSPLERQVDDFNHRIDEAIKKAPQLAEQLEELRRRGVAAIEATADTLEKRFGDAIHGAVEGIVTGTRDAEDILDLFKDAAIGTFAELFTETITKKTSLLDIPLQGNLLEDIPAIFNKAASLILGGDFGSIFGDLLGLKTTAEGGLLSALTGSGGGGGGLAGLLGLGGGAGATLLARNLGVISSGAFGSGATALDAGAAAQAGVTFEGTAAGASTVASRLSSLTSSYVFWGVVAAAAAEVGNRLQQSGSPQVRGLGRGLTSAGQPISADSLRNPFTTSGLEELGQNLLVGGPGIKAILDAIGFSPFGSGPSSGQLSRRFIGTDVLGGLGSLSGLDFDPSEFAAPFEKFPELAKEAGAAATAFATALAAGLDSGVEDTEELRYVFNTLIDNFGEGGITGEEATIRIAAAMKELGIDSATAGQLITDAFQRGEISLEQYQAAMVGLQDVTAVSVESMVATLEQGLGEEARGVFDRLVEAGVDSFQAVLAASNEAFVGIASGLSTGLLPSAVEVFSLIRANGISAAKDIERAFASISGVASSIGESPAKWFVGDSGKLVYGSISGGQFRNAPAPLLSAAEQVATRRTATRIPGFAEGGIVPGFAGEPMFIMAHGRETVLPTHSDDGIRRFARSLVAEMGGMQGAPTVVYLQVDGRTIARAIANSGGYPRGIPL